MKLYLGGDPSQSQKKQFANGRIVNYHIMTNNAVIPDNE
jgi:hypothetical protein